MSAVYWHVWRVRLQDLDHAVDVDVYVLGRELLSGSRLDNALAELGPVERLNAAVGLAYSHVLGGDPFGGSEPVAARLADAPADDLSSACAGVENFGVVTGAHRAGHVADATSWGQPAHRSIVYYL